MKIKDVIEKTDLTDRAIRLYIESGLVSPSFNESYAGRKNIDFSEQDIEMLKNIAILRKADFSIAEIKQLKTNPENCKNILQSIIDRTNKRILADTEAVNNLNPLLKKDELSIELICSSLAPSTADKPVPREDSELSLTNKITRIFFLVAGIIGMVYFAATVVCIVITQSDYSFLYPHLLNLIYFPVCFVLLFFVSLYYILTYKNKKAPKKIFTSKRTILSLILAVVFGWSAFFSGVTAMASSWLDIPLSYSQTRLKSNYMFFDNKEAEKQMSEFFPEAIPGKNAKYFYRYIDHGHGTPEPVQTEVVLETELSLTDFIYTVEYCKSFRPFDAAVEPYEEEKGDWTCIFYRGSEEDDPTQLSKSSASYVPVFAYNSKTNEVRYMSFHGMTMSTVHKVYFDGDTDRLKLDW